MSNGIFEVDLRGIVTEVQPMDRTAVDGLFVTETTADNTAVNNNGDSYLGTVIDMPATGYSTIQFDHITTPIIITPERQAFILLKVLTGRRLTEVEKESLKNVMAMQRERIGEAEANIVLQHIMDGDLLFRDEELIERCIELLEEEIDNPPVRISSTWDCTGVTGPSAPGDLWHNTTTNKLYVTTTDGSTLEIGSATDDDTIEKPGTSGTIGEA